MEADHPTEGSLYAWLDDALTDDRAIAIAKHVEACEFCQQRVAVIQRLFQVISSLPEYPLERDLSAGVIAQIPHKAGVGQRVRWFTALELLAVLMLSALLWPLVVQQITQVRPVAVVPALWEILMSVVRGSLEVFDTWIAQLGQISMGDLLPYIPSLPSSQLWLMVAAGLAVCLLGNGLLYFRMRGDAQG